MTATTHDLVTRCFSYLPPTATRYSITLNNTAPPTTRLASRVSPTGHRPQPRTALIYIICACMQRACMHEILLVPDAGALSAPCTVFQYWITNCIYSKDSIQVHILSGNAPQLCHGRIQDLLGDFRIVMWCVAVRVEIAGELSSTGEARGGWLRWQLALSQVHRPRRLRETGSSL